MVAANLPYLIAAPVGIGAIVLQRTFRRKKGKGDDEKGRRDGDGPFSLRLSSAKEDQRDISEDEEEDKGGFAASSCAVSPDAARFPDTCHAHMLLSCGHCCVF